MNSMDDPNKELPILPRRNPPGRYTLAGDCLEDGCDRPRKARGLCTIHYNALRRMESLERGEICKAEGCELPIESRGYCSGHYQKARDNGELPDKINSRGHPIGEWGYQHGPAGGYQRVKRRNPDGTEDFKMAHRLVMGVHLGRELTEHESVHHKNGQRDDNRIENLELWSRFQPAGQRVSDKVAWAKELLALYEPGSLK